MRSADLILLGLGAGRLNFGGREEKERWEGGFWKSGGLKDGSRAVEDGGEGFGWG